MFKLFVKLMLFVLVLALAGPFLMKGPDGRPLWSLADLKLPEFRLPGFTLPSAQDTESSATPAASAQQWIEWSDRPGQTPLNPDVLTREQLALLDIKAQDNIYYRWQDARGVWQFSSLPNRNTLNHVVRTDPNANVLQSMTQDDIDKVFGRQKPEQDNSITQNNPAANGKGMESGMLPIPTTVPVTEIPKLLEQAKDVQRIAEERVKQMDGMAR